jgi:O-antigen/teichoic acid export membrane protein
VKLTEAASRLKRNIIANLLGNLLTAILFIICIPIYVKFLGVESYGLIGFFASLLVIFFVLDAGLSSTINREFARLPNNEAGLSEKRDLLRTFELLYIGAASFICFLIWFSAPFLSKHWLNSSHLSVNTVKFAVMQMGILLALRWPTALYAGGLTGLQKQVTFNVINTIGETVKAVGAIAVLAFVQNSITAFFYWQIIVSAIIIFVFRFFTWTSLPLSSHEPTFSISLLKKNRSFAIGIGGTSLAVVILTQADKIILSKMLDLQTFGYFAMASAIASSLNKITLPFSQAIYPRIVQLVHGESDNNLILFFHKSCQLIAALILPGSLLFVFFAKEIIMIWSNNPTITTSVYPLVRILIIGTAANALVTIPYNVQLAYGWTKLGLYQNVLAIIVLIPAIIFLTYNYGVSGAVWGWTILNASYIVISVPLMFRKLLTSEKWKWYWNDLFYLVLITLLPMGLFRLLFDSININNKFFTIAYCLAVFIIVSSIAVMGSQNLKQFLVDLRDRYFASRTPKIV